MFSNIEIMNATEGAAFDLTTLEAVKTELSIEDANSDSELQDQISFYSKLIASLCDRVFAAETVVETFVLNYERPVSLPLSRYPVNYIESVTIDGVDVSDDLYDLNNASGMLQHYCGSWCGRRVVVTYNGGYDLPDDAPAPLARACVEFVKDQRLTQGRDPTIREISHADSTVSYWVGSRTQAGSDALPPGVEDLISPFKRLTV